MYIFLGKKSVVVNQKVTLENMSMDKDMLPITNNSKSKNNTFRILPK